MRGDLSETPAADLCRVLAASGADGVLDIEGPDGRGLIAWRDGAIVAATSPTPRARLGDRLVNAGLLEEADLESVLRSQARADSHQRLGALLVDRGLVSQDAVRLVAQEQVIDAVFDVLRWRYGAYRLEPTRLTEVHEVSLRIPVDQLLVDVARRQEEWTELERVIPDLDAVPSFATGTSSAAASLEPDEFAVLASIDGNRSVREIAADLGYGDFEAARIIYGLALLGIVEVAPPEDEIGRALDDALAQLAGTPPDPDSEPTDAPPAPVEEPAAETPQPPVDEPTAETPQPPVDEPAAETPQPPVDEPAADDPDDGLSQLLEELSADASDEPDAVPDEPDAPDAPIWVDVPDELPPAADEPPTEPVPDRPPSPRDRNVSELLRELSNLSVDEPPPPPRSPGSTEPPRPSGPPRRAPTQPDPKRKRRLFGRGS